jgi:hypothetical protein
MSSAIESVPVAQPRPAFARALHWALQGLRWWRRAPLMLLLLCLIQLLVESLLQLIPWVGVTLSKLVVPLLVMGILLGLNELAHGGRLRFASLLGCFRRERFMPSLGLAALWGFAVFGFQQLIAGLVYGWPALDAVLLGHMATHPELASLQFERILMIPGLLPITLLSLSPFLLMFRGVSPWQAVCGSARLVLANVGSFAWFLLLNVMLFVLIFAGAWTQLLLLLVGPWSVAASYAVWRDVSTSVPLVQRATGN